MSFVFFFFTFRLSSLVFRIGSPASAQDRMFLLLFFWCLWFFKHGRQFFMIMSCSCFKGFALLYFLFIFFAFFIDRFANFCQFYQMALIIWLLILILFQYQNLRFLDLSLSVTFLFFSNFNRFWTFFIDLFEQPIEILDKNFDLFNVRFLNSDTDFLSWSLANFVFGKLNSGGVGCGEDSQQSQQEETDQKMFPHRI